MAPAPSSSAAPRVLRYGVGHGDARVLEVEPGESYVFESDEGETTVRFHDGSSGFYRVETSDGEAEIAFSEPSSGVYRLETGAGGHPVVIEVAPDGSGVYRVDVQRDDSPEGEPDVAWTTRGGGVAGSAPVWLHTVPADDGELQELVREMRHEVGLLRDTLRELRREVETAGELR